MSLAEQAREAVRDALWTERVSQAELARRTGHSKQHVNRTLNGKAAMSLDAAEQWLAAIGYHAELAVTKTKEATRGD